MILWHIPHRIWGNDDDAENGTGVHQILQKLGFAGDLKVTLHQSVLCCGQVDRKGLSRGNDLLVVLICSRDHEQARKDIMQVTVMCLKCRTTNRNQCRLPVAQPRNLTIMEVIWNLGGVHKQLLSSLGRDQRSFHGYKHGYQTVCTSNSFWFNFRQNMSGLWPWIPKVIVARDEERIHALSSSHEWKSIRKMWVSGQSS